MGVHVDKARGDDFAGGVDGLGGRRVAQIADFRDFVPRDAHIGAEGFVTYTVGHQPADDFDVQHDEYSSSSNQVVGCQPQYSTGDRPLYTGYSPISSPALRMSRFLAVKACATAGSKSFCCGFMWMGTACRAQIRSAQRDASAASML